MELESKDWIHGLKNGDRNIFRKIFDRYFVISCSYLYRMNHNQQLCEDICQEVFIDIWNKREKINIHTSIEAYIKRSARNKFFNHVRDNKWTWDRLEENQQVENKYDETSIPMETAEFNQMVYGAIDRLPPRCRLIFSLSRFEELSYKGIAHELQISVKTVENQMSKALKILRVEIYGKDSN